MNGRIWTTIALASLATGALAGIGSAHTRWYANWSAVEALKVALVDCGDGTDPVINNSFGGFCINDPTDPITITITDDVSGNVRATACQDLNNDGVCSGAERTPFCGSVTLTGVDVGREIIVFLGSVQAGLPPGPCGIATHGRGDH